MPALSLLLPSSLDLVGWAGVIVATLAMTGLGRIVTAWRAMPESALIAGWGTCAVVLTLLGIVTPMDLRFVAIALIVVGLFGLIGASARAPFRVLVLAVPLLAIMAGARPSLPDTWLNLLPNAAYLYDHGFFPADARPDAHSFIAGAPYNMQIASYLAGLFLPNFPGSAMIDFNIVLLLAAGLLLARIMTGDDNAVPRWPVIALGILLATALNPGFDPRYHLSPYGETSVTVTLLFAGWHAARALDRIAGGRDAQGDLLVLAPALAALVNIKQESVALAFGVVVTALVLAATARARRREAFTSILLMSFSAVVLYLGWRWYVLAHFQLGELKGLPFDQWHIFALPQILLSMVQAIGEKILYFAILAVALVIAARRWLHRELDLGTRLAIMLLGTAVIYNLALLGAYIAHFEGQMGLQAHSYYRYNTHLSLLLMASLIMLTRGWRWRRLERHWPRAVPALPVLLVLLVPLPFLRMLRFDLEVPNLRTFQLAQEIAPRIADDAHLLLILPGDNGTLPPTIEGVLRYLPPRRRFVQLDVATDLAQGLAMPDETQALLSCAPPDYPLVPAGDAAMLQRQGDIWKVAALLPYLPVPPHAHWSQVLAPAPLCLTQQPKDSQLHPPAG